LFTDKKENETDFCESYKSQILNEHAQNNESSFSIILKILTILLLLAVIVAVSLYGYNYFMNSKKDTNITMPPPISMQTPAEELKVIDTELKITEETVKEKKKVLDEPVKMIMKSESPDIEQIANDVKIAISDSESAEKKLEDQKNEPIKKVEEKLEVPLSSSEAKYLEELADLSREIDKERK
jgi:hypothetical protein